MKEENDVQGVPPSGSGSAVVPSRDATPSGTSDPSRGNLSRKLPSRYREVVEELIETIHWDRTAERIACSAIWFQDGKTHAHAGYQLWKGFVVCGLRHHHCFAIAAAMGYEAAKSLPHEQGFLTTEGRFVSREEAGGIAYSSGQTLKYHKRLFSEDVFVSRARDRKGGEAGPEGTDTPEEPGSAQQNAPK